MPLFFGPEHLRKVWKLCCELQNTLLRVLLFIKKPVNTIPVLLLQVVYFLFAHHRTCTSRNLINVILCVKCNLICIGETMRRMADRFTEHLRSILLRMPRLPITTHFFNDYSTDDIKKITWIKLCQGPMQIPGPDHIRKDIEQRILYELGTVQPGGLNASFTAFK